MLDGPLVFVDVDTQRDFLDPEGALPVPGSAAIRPNLARLTALARLRGIPILASGCAHEADDAEFAQFGFPPHCLLGTDGQARVAETAWPGGLILAEGSPVPAVIPAHLTIHKRQFDLFGAPGADRVVELYARGDPTFVVYGVATDYCVRCAVEGLLGRGRKVALVVDAIRAVDASAEADLLTRFARAGALLTMTDVV